MHEGEFLKKYIKTRPMKVTRVVELTGIQRPTVYTHFNKEKLDSLTKELYSEKIGIVWTGQILDNWQENKQHTSFTDSERIDVNKGSRINPTFPGMPDREENNITGIERYISPDHTPIPVYDDTGDIHNIDELLKNNEVKPVVLIMKGHLGCHAVVRHNDSAMDKDFLQGNHQKCQLGIQRVFHFKNTIIPGMAAIIILEEFTITRYVHRTDNKDQLLLRSADTVLFPDMIIDIAHIKQMWRIKSVTPVVQSKILMY